MPNPSFEEYTDCEYFVGNFRVVKGWKSATSEGTVDYFNTCAYGYRTGVPCNDMGCQQPKSGRAYTGIYALSNVEKEWRELIVAELDTPLVKGEVYHVGMYLSAAEYINDVVAGVGIYLTDSWTSVYRFRVPEVEPQTSLGKEVFLTDSVNWTEISGSYTARGGERFIVIGNFYKPANLPIRRLTKENFATTSYYYVDDVWVIKASEYKRPAPIKADSLITLKDVLFKTNDSVPDPSITTTLKPLARYLALHPDIYIHITGYTDSVGSESHNIKLSEARARAIANVLVSLGVKREKLRTAGRGSANPIAPNTTPEGRSQNRRVELELFKAKE